MEFLGFSNDLNTPIGQLIKSATDSLRISPDWGKNLEVSDYINRHRDCSEAAFKALKRRLQDSDQQTVYLALLLLESCMKNCPYDYFIGRFDKSIMDEIVNMSRGSKGAKNSEEALRLIQQWGRTYEAQRKFPIFYDTYVGMRNKGAPFPKEDEATLKAYSAPEPAAKR